MTQNLTLPKIFDCMPAMADVLSGTVPRPRERKPRENAFRWLADATPVMKRLEREFPEFANRWPEICYRPDVKPPASLGLAGFPTCYLMTWEGGAQFLFVNEDGTSFALLDPVAVLLSTWERLTRSTGKPRHENPSAATLAKRELRARAKAK